MTVKERYVIMSNTSKGASSPASKQTVADFWREQRANGLTQSQLMAERRLLPSIGPVDLGMRQPSPSPEQPPVTTDSRQNTQPGASPTLSTTAPLTGEEVRQARMALGKDWYLKQTPEQIAAFKLSVDQMAKELLDNLNRNVMEDSAVDEELRSRLSAKDWTQAKAEKIVAEIRAERAKEALDNLNRKAGSDKIDSMDMKPPSLLPESFPPGTRFADVEGVPVSETDIVCTAWDPSPRRFPGASFLRNGTLVPEAEFRAMVMAIQAGA